MITKENAKTRLLDYRLENNITQTKISEKSGISLPTISGIESGSLTPQSMTIHKLNRYFLSVGIKD